MNAVVFKKLSIENFLSIGSGSVSLSERGLLLIQGVNQDDPSANSNGAGKSSTVDALCWGLFGTTARGVSGDSVVNRFTGKGCKVTVDFEIGKDQYAIARHRKHKTGKNRIEFSHAGNDLTLGTDKLTQELIERTIGCSLEVFTASIYAGQEMMPNLPAMTDKELKNLTEQAAGIDVLERAYDIAREKYRNASALSGGAQAKIDSAIEMVRLREDSLNHAQHRHESWLVDRDSQVETLRSALIDSAAALKVMIAGQPDINAITAKIAEQEQVQGELLSRSSSKTKIEMPAHPMLTKYSQRYPDAVAAMTQSLKEVDKEVIASNGVCDQLQTAIRDIDKRVGQPCNECGKPYHESDLEGVKARLQEQLQGALEKTGELADESASINARLFKVKALADAHIVAVDSENEKLEAEFAQAMADYKAKVEAATDTDLLQGLSDVAADLRALNADLTAANSYKSRVETNAKLYKQAQANLQTLKESESPHASDIEAAKSNLEKAVANVETVKGDASEQIEAEAAAKAVVELFSPKGIRGEILDSVTPFLNERTGHYLGVLSDGQIEAEWKTIGETGKGEAREKFHITVENKHGAEDFAGLSGGERRKVRVSTAMALQDLVASRADRPIRLFVADEVDDALDVSGLERLMTILDEKARSVGTVLVISHNDLGDWISEQITVIKSGNSSEIIEL